MRNKVAEKSFAPTLGIGVVVAALLSPLQAYAAPAAPVDPALQIDRLWVLITAAMVFFMQVGFLALEAGAVRPKAAPVTAMKNVVDWMICAIAFFFFGWAIMFGHTAGGLLGSDGFSLAVDTSKGWAGGTWVHFIFQLAFAGTAATIVSGALAERTSFAAYMICSAVITILIYPVFGHWAWGNSFFADNDTILTRIGFLDFAGSTVVHSVGGWVALVGIIAVGPRVGRFWNDGSVRPLPANNVALSAMGVLILWFGWWGFNGGSTLALNEQVGSIINNTNISAACGGLGAMLYAFLFEKKAELSSKFLNGVLGGLVAVTASCNIVTPISAAVIGLVGGAICNIVTAILLKCRLDDPVGAVPVHLGCGIWGTLCVGIFGAPEMFPQGYTRMDQISVQMVGIAACGAWTVGISLIMFKLIKYFVGLRVSPQEEVMGYEIGGMVNNKDDSLPTNREAARQVLLKQKQ